MVAAVAAILRRLRAERGMAVLVFVVVAVTSFVVAAGPRLFNDVADEGLRYGVANATAVGRNFQFSRVDRVPSDDVDPLARVASRGESLRLASARDSPRRPHKAPRQRGWAVGRAPARALDARSKDRLPASCCI